MSLDAEAATLKPVLPWFALEVTQVLCTGWHPGHTGCYVILWENTSFHNAHITHDGRNKCQVIFNFKENQGKSLINTEQMVFDEHIFVFNKNRLHHCEVHTQIMGKHFFL